MTKSSTPFSCYLCYMLIPSNLPRGQRTTQTPKHTLKSLWHMQPCDDSFDPNSLTTPIEIGPKSNPPNKCSTLTLESPLRSSDQKETPFDDYYGKRHPRFTTKLVQATKRRLKYEKEPSIAQAPWKNTNPLKPPGKIQKVLPVQKSISCDRFPLKHIPRSSREVRIRDPFFGVYFRGVLPTKKGVKKRTTGDLD